jgi:two-component system, NtrC family, sensor kinase
MTKYSNQEQEVINVHNFFWEALANRDIDRRFSCCSEDVTFIGTGLYEKANNKTEYRKINEKGVQQFPDPFQIKFLWLNISMFNQMACVESEVIWNQTINGKVLGELVRSTTLLKHEAGTWKIVHVHGSVPDYRLAEGEYMTNEKILLRNKELEQQVYERTRELNQSLEELKSTQSQLIQSEKMASLGELTAGIAHEIQNPLNFVNNFSELSNELMEEMKEELEESSRQYAAGSRQSGEEKLNLAKEIAGDIKQNLEKINHHGKRAADIVKGMLQHSRTSSGIKEPTDINALADEYLRLAYHGLRAKDKSFNADFRLEADENLPKINVIPQDIGRVLLNLINNAFYAVDKRAKSSDPLTPKGEMKNDQNIYQPTVTVSTTSSKSPSGDLGVRVVVKDNGDGIPPLIVDKIFQPFFTTKPTGQGTGLGLSLSYDIVKAHGGELKVETKEREGSEFIIIIPI